MISREFCKGQIERLYQFRGYPKANFDGSNESAVVAAVRELVAALQCAPTEDVAKEVIDFYTQSQEGRECPLPPEIRRAVTPRQALEEWGGWTVEDIGELCEKCRSWGSVKVGDAFERCTCESGKELPQALLDFMNAPTKPDPKPQSFGGSDFDATVRRAIIARMVGA